MRGREFSGTSKRGRSLLAHEEGHDVEYKESVKALDTVDLVAFANSDAGGAILVGVAEQNNKKGRRVGKIVGCKVSDPERQKILSKAANCVAPVSVEIFIENSSKLPFLRIEIPSGPNRPYCTGDGTYKTRGDGRNVLLKPIALLERFMEAESTAFFERFRHAADALEEHLAAIRAQAEEGFLDLKSRLDQASGELDVMLSDLLSTAGEATDAAQESDSTSSIIEEEVRSLGGDVGELGQRLLESNLRMEAILRKLGIEDPVALYRQQLAERAALQYLRGLPMRVFRSKRRAVEEACLFCRIETSSALRLFEQVKRERLGDPSGDQVSK